MTDKVTTSLVDKAKDYIVNEFLDGYPNASFVELERKLKENAFYEKVENDSRISISNNEMANVITWITENKVLCNAFVELHKEKKIAISGTSPMIYAMDGGLLKYPMPKSIAETRSNPDKFYWLPVVLNSPQRHRSQQIIERIRRNNVKRFTKFIAEPASVKRHICASGIGYYPIRGTPDYEEIESLFHDIYYNYLKHSEKCDMPDQVEIKTCKEFIQLECSKTKTIMKQHSSYGLKHIVERWTEKTKDRHQYISNGSFIVAASELGYKMKQEDPTSLNAYFNLDVHEKRQVVTEDD